MCINTGVSVNGRKITAERKKRRQTVLKPPCQKYLCCRCSLQYNTHCLFFCCNLFSVGWFTFSFHHDRWHLSACRRSCPLAEDFTFLLRFQPKQQTAFTAFLAVSLFGFEKPCFFEITNSAANGGGRILEVGCYGRDGRPTLVVLVCPVNEIDIYRNGQAHQEHGLFLVRSCTSYFS